jgi:hypothetical protein
LLPEKRPVIAPNDDVLAFVRGLVHFTSLFSGDFGFWRACDTPEPLVGFQALDAHQSVPRLLPGKRTDLAPWVQGNVDLEILPESHIIFLF